MEFWALMIAFVVFVLLLNSGELPLALFAALLALGITDEKTLKAIARNLGKLYYKVNKELADLLNLNISTTSSIDLRNVAVKGIGSVAEWRSKRLVRKTTPQEDVLKLLYKKYIESGS